MPPDELVAAAREWLLDLDGGVSFNEFDSQEDYVAHVNELGPDEIRMAVNRHYDGGWPGFVQDAQ